MRRTFAALAVVLALCVVDETAAGPLGYYEWMAVSPIVATGTSRGEYGRHTHFAVERVLRGGERVASGQVIRVLVRHANRNRNLDADRKPVHLLEGESYVLLLEPVGGRDGDGPGTFELARGVRGARQLPAEGAEALIATLSHFVEIQAARSDSRTWAAFASMLESSDPLLLETALDQFVKFRRGSPELLPTLRPTLAHPDPALRERAALLIGQILERGSDSVAVGQPLYADLVGHARRDPAVPVRVAATRALGVLPDGLLGMVLEEIAESDPDQTVRYTAETLLFERAGRARPSGTTGHRTD